ncbi:MAG TPA: phage portal protein [Leptospiraceae bacterium]|nr:phage portal protein [Anaerolineales bacterium]HNN58551.1 phage portal protein [Leptospiraceae bacterium]HNN76489.1 phage portal protein [Leptospiraceae bacterium]
MARRTKLQIAKEKLELIETQQKIQKYELQQKVMAIVDTQVGHGGGTPYDGASITSQANQGWYAFSGDPDDTLLGMQRLRERSRDLYTNNVVGGGAIRTKTSSVIGSGLKLQSAVDPKLVGLADTVVREKENEIERLWEMWVKEADASNQCDYYELQDQAYRTFLICGDSFTVFPRIERPNSPFSFRIKVIEGDRCSNPNYQSDNAALRGGVVIGPNEEPLGYHFRFRKALWQDTWQYFPAFGGKSGRRNAIHLMRQDRPGAKRGTPMLTIMMSHLKQIGRYMDAETMAAVISSFFVGFVESSNDDALSSTITNFFQREAGIPDATPPRYDIVPGTIQHLRNGEKMNLSAPGRPNNSFGAFMQSMMEFAGMGLEIPYEILMRHYSSSYSASRGARIDWERVAKIDRVWFNRKWNQQIYENWLFEQVAFGMLDLPGFLTDPYVREAWCNAVWTGDAAGLLDPQKEVSAAISRIEAGLSTRTLEAAGLTGMDFEHILTILATEQQMMKDKGVTIGMPSQSSGSGFQKNQDPQNSDQQPQGEGQ